ncbi:MAG: hypothetical protein CR988_06160 [Treponema sp.]|nr:MAG: hypothetical protein CR988_06160 [Treponema sp.]
MKKNLCVFSLLILVAGTTFAQQITKVAVLDTDRIYSTFRMESQAARDYEQKKERYQKEIEKMKDEILQLNNKKLEAKKNKKDDKIIKKYEAVISSKTSFLSEYAKTKNEELKRLKKRLLTDDKFYSALFDAVKKVAETEGYTIVFTLQESLGIIWFSQTVDITDMVINSLKGI